MAGRSEESLGSYYTGHMIFNTSNSLAGIYHVCYRLLQGQTLLSVASSPGGLTEGMLLSLTAIAQGHGCVKKIPRQAQGAGTPGGQEECFMISKFKGGTVIKLRN